MVWLAGFGDDARIGGVDAIDVGIDLALVGFQRRSQRHAGGVGAATAERGDVAVLVHTLEACNDNDLAFVEVATHWRVINIEDASLGVQRVRQDLDLAPGVALGRHAGILERHAQQTDGDLLAGRHDDIEFAWAGIGCHFFRQRDQAVGLAAHRRHHDHHLMARRTELRDLARDVLDAIGASHGGAAVLLNYQCHCRIQVLVDKARNSIQRRDFLRGRQEAKRGDRDLRIFLSKSPKSTLYVEGIVTYTPFVL